MDELGGQFDIDAAMERKPLGELIQLLKTEGLIDSGLAEILREALAARNELIHRFFVNNFDFVTEPGRWQMIKRLRELRFRIGRAQVVFSEIREKAYEAFFGITKEKAYAMYQKRMADETTSNQEVL